MRARLELTLLLLLLIASARAQNYTYVSGLITDASAASVPGALVTVVNEDFGFRRETLSRADGSYFVASLQPGSYKITVRKPGFRTMIRFGVKLAEARPARADFNLVIGSIQETITVEGTATLVERADASVSTLIEREFMERLPVNGQSLLHVLEFAPGVVVTPATNGEAGQFTVNGQRPNTHSFMIDGVSANSGVSGGGSPAESTGGTLPGMTAFGSLDSIAALDELQEVRVQTSTTSPEFGRLPGAQISLTSQSGSNGFHGSVFYAFRNQVFDANDWFANRQGQSRGSLNLQHVVPEFGGPLWRNHTFFYLSYEQLRLSQPLEFQSPVPTPGAIENALGWAQQVLSFFPQPNGPGYGNGLAQWSGQVIRPAHLDGGSVRIDQAVTSRLSAFARFHESASSVEFGSTPVNWLDLRTGSLTLGMNFRATPNLILDLRLNGSGTSTRSLWQPASSALPACYLAPVVSSLVIGTKGCDFLMRVSIAGVGQVVAGSEGRRSQSQLQVTHTLSFNRGSHSVRAGADFRQLSPYRRDANPSFSIIANSVTDFFGSGNLWTSNSPAKTMSARLTEASVFGQDTWQVTRNLTATYGLRWEISPAPISSQTASLLEGYSVPPQSPIWQSTYANFAWRAGLAYRFKDSKTILRGGAGLYFDTSLSLATDLVNDGPLNVAQYGSARHAPFASTLLFGFLPGLQLPRVMQWNLSLEHAIGDHDAISVAYVGSSASNLIRREIGGDGTTDLTLLALATNHGESDYHSLQAQYRRRFARGLQALVSYAWAHSTDNSSTDGGLYWATVTSDHASSNFDVRQAFTAGFSWQFPHGRGWAMDGVVRARSGFPINVLNTGQYLGVPFENVYRPNLVGGEPVWIDDASSPAGGRINPAAFHSTPDGVQGNLGRNALTGFGMNQVDLALHREFVFHEQRSVDFRIEAYNAFNHPNFGDPVRILVSPVFGQSTSMLNSMLGTGSPGSGLSPLFQSGGPRSVQVALRFRW